MIEWIFDPAPPSGARKGGLANAQVFDPEIDSFVREGLQNSRDQKLEHADAVDVRFVVRDLANAELERFLHALAWSSLAPHVEDAAEHGGITMTQRLREGLAEVDERRLRLVLIEDRGTRGLTGGEDDDESNYNALCRHELVTSSDRRDSGGSFGIGKSVLWRFSSLSTVLFGSWVSDFDRMRFFGRTLLPGHTTPDGRWEGSGWLGKPDPALDGKRAVSVLGAEAEDLAESLYVNRSAGETGTSILVVGFDEPALETERPIEDLCEAITDSAIRWFWPALLDDAMRVLVEGWRDDERVFARHANATSPAVAPFVEAQCATAETDDSLDGPGEVVERELRLSIPAQRDGAFPHARPAMEVPVRLRVRQAESGETDHLNTVALQRGTGMVVAYRETRRRSGTDMGFHAVLLAGLANGDSHQDRAAEEFLRAAEPPAHTDWTHKTERIKAEYRAGSKSSLDALFAAIDTAIRDLSREEVIESDEGPEALRKLFPLPGVGDPPERHPQFRVSEAEAWIDTDRWAFRGRYQRREATDEPWAFRIVLLLDQETGGSPSGGERIAIDQVAADGYEVVGPESDGSVLVKVPAGIREARFTGRSAAVTDLPAGGLGRVRLRMDVRATSASEVGA